ncbi:MAG: hypothetical protein ABL999_11750 [Pyrinomonadaceae bacterium]
MKALYTILICLLVVAASYAQSDPPQAPAIEEVYLARDNGEGKAGEQVTEFRTTDVPIYCVVLLDSQAKAVVKMNFVAVAVSGVKPETKVVTASYTTNGRQNRVNFTGLPDDKWTPGKYRVDLFIDGKLVKNVEFDIKGIGTVNGITSAAKYLQAPAVPPKPKPAKRQKPQE